MMRFHVPGLYLGTFKSKMLYDPDSEKSFFLSAVQLRHLHISIAPWLSIPIPRPSNTQLWLSALLLPPSVASLSQCAFGPEYLSAILSVKTIVSYPVSVCSGLGLTRRRCWNSHFGQHFFYKKSFHFSQPFSYNSGSSLSSPTVLLPH